MDSDAGANPFHHSFLLFSKQETADGPIEVVDSIGYYSQPSTTTNPIVKKIKSLLGLNVDLQDGHGVLGQESMRNISGNGLRGISFSINEIQFLKLQKKYQDSIIKQEEAIAELNAELTAQGIPANGYTRHLAEKEKAKLEQRKPRLHPFHVTMEASINGFDSSASYTCKDQSLDFLQDEGVIAQPLRNKIDGSKATRTFPRFHSLPLPPIRLINTGSLETVNSRTGKIFHNPTWKSNKLFWASAPVLESEPKTVIAEAYYDLKHMLNRIAKMEKELYTLLDKRENIEQNQINQLRIQLKRVQNLAFLFNNAHVNQGKYLAEHLATADKVLNVASLAMEPERINASFMLRAYNSIAAQSILLGLLTTALAIALIFIAPVAVGINLAALGAVGTGRAIYSFYQEETMLAKTKKDTAQLNEDFTVQAMTI